MPGGASGEHSKTGKGKRIGEQSTRQAEAGKGKKRSGGQNEEGL